MKTNEPLDNFAMHFYKVIASQLALTALAIVLIITLEQTFSYSDALSIKTFSLALIFAILTYVLIAIISRSNSTLGISLRKLSQLVLPMFSGLNWFQILLIAILAGISEELLFRVFLQSWITSLSNIWIGVFVASLIFGLLHFISVFYFVFTFFFGLLLGIVYYTTDSASLVIYWHAFYDVIAIAVLAKFPYLLKLNEYE